MEEEGFELNELPHVIQYNKRDLPNIMTIEELEKECNPYGAKYFETIATNGEGVFDSLKLVAKEVIKRNQQ